MRVTLDIDDDVMCAVRENARLTGRNIGVVASELARRGLARKDPPVVEIQDGIPVWVHGPGATPVTSDLVRELGDDC